jgi:capsular polysaccharide biosynthesis protein
MPVFAEFGLERVRPDHMTFAEQVGAFGAADLIVIEGGAAVANVAFARPGTQVLVLVGDRLDHSFFAGIADHGGQVMTHLSGTRVASHPKLYQCRYAIDPEALRRALVSMTR